jgi:short-subunit dehydrogenase
MRDLQGRSALVTGASSEIGEAVARRLAGAGMRLVLSGRDSKQLAATAETVVDSDPYCLPADLSDGAEVVRLAAEADRLGNGVDVLVNVAGAVHVDPFDRLSDDDIEAQLFVNLTAPLILVRRLLPGMLDRRRGHVVLIGSLAGLVGGAYQAPYAAAKAGIDCAVRALREETRGSGVGFSVVHPGPVRGRTSYGRMADAGRRSHPAGAERRVPWPIGETTPQCVARAVMRSIQRSRPQLLVSPRPGRAVLAVAAVHPGAAAALLRRAGLTRYFQSLTGVPE